MKKILLFAVALLGSLSMMAANGSYSNMTVSGDTTTWDFGTATTGSSIKIASGTVDNGILFISSALGDQQLASSGGLSNKKESELYFPVSNATAAGTISMTTFSSSDSRWLQLFVGTTNAGESKRLWSKSGDGTDGKKGPQSFEFTSADLTEHEGNYYLKFASNNTEMKIATITIVESGPTPTDVATLKDIKVNGTSIEGFAAATETYNVELPYGTTVVPTVTATATLSNETVAVTPAAALPGATTILVTAGDGTTTKTYTVNFTVSTVASNDANLKSLSIDGKGVTGFKADSIAYEYAVPAAQAALPVVAAEANEEHANVVINQAAAVPGTATVVVTAQDGTTTKTYTIAFTRAEALKDVNEVIMSNSYSAWWSEGDTTKTIHAYYLQGETVPTVDSAKVSEGATWVVEANTFKVTGADATVAEYPLVIEAVAPLAYTADTIVFDGTENYIKAGYGFDATKKWRFSKTDTDYTRERTGKTHIELFLPACASVSFKESCGQTRAIRLYINGVEFGEKTTQVKNGWNTFQVNQTAPFMLSIVSAQTGGDGGIAAMVMTDTTTANEYMEAAPKAVKRIINGQLFIEKNGVLYNALGAKL